MPEYAMAGRWGPRSITDRFGNALVGARVYVYEPGTETLAQLYSDEDKQDTADNPTIVDGSGNADFYAEPGYYRMLVASSGRTLWDEQVLVQAHPFDQAPPGPEGPPGPAGTLNWRGQWDSSTEYEPDDGVSDEGSSWVALEANQNVKPGTEPTVWSLAAAKGDQGEQGPKGDQGPQGDSLEYDWSGTELGVRVEGEPSYIYTDLEGPQGEQGEQGPKGDTGDQGDPGPGLEYDWSGTDLGVRVEGDASYTYTDLEGPQGPKGDKGDTGDFENVWQGTWDSNTTYSANDVVEHDGSSYISLVNSNTDEPPSVNWETVAAKGVAGDGVPDGGSTGEYLRKASDTDQDVAWQAADAPTQAEFDDHSARHESGGADVINVGGLSGELADPQPPKSHGNEAHDATFATEGYVDNATADLEEQIEAMGSPAEQRAIDAEQNLRLWELEASLLETAEGFTGWNGEAFLEHQDNVESLTGDEGSIERGVRLADGRFKLDAYAIDPDLAAAIDADDYGAPVMGGFYAGIIDPDPTEMSSGEVYTTPQRYALIVAPKSLEGGNDTPTGDLVWCDSSTNVADARTRWNGLDATQAMIAAGLTNSIADFVDALNSNSADSYDSSYGTDTAPPEDDGSEWYIPALDELDLCYRHLKPTTDPEDDGTYSNDFPDGEAPAWGNPSSDPTFASRLVETPSQTDASAFQSGGGEEFDDHPHWTSTEGSSSDVWGQNFDGNDAGRQSGFLSKTWSGPQVRPVRRVLIN